MSNTTPYTTERLSNLRIGSSVIAAVALIVIVALAMLAGPRTAGGPPAHADGSRGAAVADAKPEVRALRGIHYDPPRLAPDIRATDHNGKPFVLSRQPHPLQMVFFGYVSCTDVCPTNLKKMELIQKALGEDQDQVQFLFVTVAPEHETPDDLREHLDYYEGEILGITAKRPEDLLETYEQWGIMREKKLLDTPVLGRNYRYDHTAQIYLVRGGKDLVVSYPYGTDVDVMIADMRAVIADPSLAERLPEIGEVREVALPPGTFTRAAQDNPTLPAYLRVRAGDSIRWKNDDYMYHFIGDISLAPGSSALQKFDEAGTFYYGCTAVPSEVIRIHVSER